MGRRKKTGHISFWVDDEFKKALEEYAIRDKRSLSNLCEKILEDWLNTQKVGESEKPLTGQKKRA